MGELTVSRVGSDLALVYAMNLQLVKVAADLVSAAFRRNAMIISSLRNILSSIKEKSLGLEELMKAASLVKPLQRPSIKHFLFLWVILPQC